MNNFRDTDSADLPGKGQLLKSTILAIIIATILLITVILPAEYGIDPLGTGRLLGLTKMGEIKVSLAEEVSQQSDVKQNAVIQENSTIPELNPCDTTLTEQELADFRQDEVTFTLEPNRGREIKLAMRKDQQVDFLWWTDGGKANFDSHADSKSLNIDYHSYAKGSRVRDEGTLTADFDGNHGWFWRNRTDRIMTVTLQVNGEYTQLLQ